MKRGTQQWVMVVMVNLKQDPVQGAEPSALTAKIKTIIISWGLGNNISTWQQNHIHTHIYMRVCVCIKLKRDVQDNNIWTKPSLDLWGCKLGNGLKHSSEQVLEGKAAWVRCYKPASAFLPGKSYMWNGEHGLSLSSLPCITASVQPMRL